MKKIINSMAVGILLVWVNAANAHELGSNKKPIAFGNDQTIVDTSKLVFEPLKVDGLPAGAEVALVRGDFGIKSEMFIRVPAGYKVPQHTHSSDELYIWLEGEFELISADGKRTKFTKPTYISFPGNAPPHALVCGKKNACLFYLAYGRPFDIIYPKKK